MLLRERLAESLKEALRAKEAVRVSTLRLILAALKDRDIAARGKGNDDGIGEDEILTMLQSMIKQRRESIAAYEKAGRLELAEREAAEIKVIQDYLPKQMEPEEMEIAIAAVIDELGATTIKDMGKVMAALRERYAGRMDFAKAGPMVKQRLA